MNPKETIKIVVPERVAHITDPAIREVLLSRRPTFEALQRVTAETLLAAARDLQNREVPGPVAAKREDYADAAAEALARGNQWRCRAALRKFWQK